MYVLAAGESLIAAVRQAIEEDRLDDATVRAPFLGKTVIECAQEASATLLQRKVDGLRLA